MRYFDAGKFPHYFDADQLYDLRNDVFEQHNVIDDPKNASVVKHMKGLLAAETRKLPHSFRSSAAG